MIHKAKQACFKDSDLKMFRGAWLTRETRMDAVNIPYFLEFAQYPVFNFIQAFWSADNNIKHNGLIKAIKT